METTNTIKTKKPLFGNGRFFGVQLGSIEDRLDDPFSSDVDVVKYMFDKRVKISRKDKKYGTDTPRMVADRLAEKINEGKADHELIPHIDSSMKSHLVFRLDFYSALLSGVNTESSITYLLQAIESQYEVVDETPFETGPKISSGTIIKERTKYMCKGYESEWYEDWVDTYEKFEQEQSYHVSFPFAELAKERLEYVLEDVSDLSKTLEISQAISGLEERKKKVVKKTKVFEGKLIGEEQVGWHN
ncbi:hypothetical protein ACFL6I_25445 [candidate division KSB1 bacterium]